MSTFSYLIEIADLDERHSGEIEALVDTGASYTVLPSRFLRDLGVEPIGTRRLLLADGSRVDMEYGRAWATIDGDREVTIVFFGRDNGPALLGAYTLEGLALAVDPSEERLVPAAMIMY
jgi:clan AA aspartic protease